MSFLNQRIWERMAVEIISWTNLYERMLPDVRIEPATIRIPGGCTSGGCTFDRATAPGACWNMSPSQTNESSEKVYRKFPTYSDTQKIYCNHSKIWTMWLYHRVMSPNDADRMANSVDPDQTAPLGAVWSGSALFAQTYLSENLGPLWYHLLFVFNITAFLVCS